MGTPGEKSNLLKRGLFGKKELQRMVAPQSVAVIGASETPGSFGLRSLQNINIGYTGKIYPINPKRKTILEWPCYPSIKETPTVPDCVLLAIPNAAVLPTLKECAAAGVGGAIIFSSGFAEMGTEEGIRQQQEIAALALSSGMRVCGPNCMGVINIHQRVGLTFMPAFDTSRIVEGPVGIVSQSGALGYILVQAMERGVGLSYYMAPGNSCDVDICDMVNYLIDDDNTKAIACTFEGVKDGERLREVCRRALAADKPLIMCKTGKSEISKRTALSHTGTLAGASAAYDAVFAETGAVVVDDFEAILETAVFFAKAGRPKARGVGVIANSGGAAVIAADKAALYGVELPPAAEHTLDRVRRNVPPFGSVQNPADITAESLKVVSMYGDCIAAYAEDPAFATVVVPIMSASKPGTVERAQYISDLGKKLAKPICIVWLNEWYEGPGSEVYDSSTLPVFRSMGRCFAALKSWITRDERREQLLAARASRVSSASNAAAARELLSKSPNLTALTEAESKKILSLYSIKVTRETLARSADAAVNAASTIGCPVAMKAQSAAIAHKTDAGVVRLNLKTDAEVRRAFDDIMAAARRIPGSPEIEGIVVQEMIKPGVEVMIGVRQDPQFGTLVVCGLGGIFVELLKDVAVALAPIDKARARDLIATLKGYRLLTGFRGSQPVNIDALADMLCRLSELGVDLAQHIGEIDVNPVIMDAQGGTAVDALVVRVSPAA